MHSARLRQLRFDATKAYMCLCIGRTSVWLAVRNVHAYYALRVNLAAARPVQLYASERCTLTELSPINTQL